MDQETANRVEVIYNKYKKTKEKFVDTEFPANSKSIHGSGGKTSIADSEEIKWLRPHEVKPISKEDCSSSLEWSIVRDISPQDIQQGRLGNCWFVSSLAVVAQKPELIDKIILTKEVNPSGAYVIKLCKDGMWQAVIVDDLFPCDSYNRLKFANALRKQLWVSLLEKAMAKLYGSYGALQSGQSHEGLIALTGYSSHSVDLNFEKDQQDNKDLVWQILLTGARAGFLMGASCAKDGIPPAQFEKVGLQNNHAYSVLDVRAIQGFRLMQLRNPWGQGSWKGDWNVQSALWTPELIRKLTPATEDHGLFWISYDDVIRYFDHVDICQLRSNWFEQRTTNEFCNVKIPCYYIEVTKPTELELALYQNSSRTDKVNNNNGNKKAASASASGGKSQSKTDICLGIFNVSKTQFEQDKRLQIRKLSGYSPRKLSPCEISRFPDGILQPGAFLALPFSFLNFRDQVSPKKFALSIHSSAPVKVKQLTVSPKFLSIAMINFTVETGNKKTYGDKLVIYSKTTQFSGRSLVVENLHEDKYIHFKGDYHGCENIVSTRSGMTSYDVIPPLHRQLIVVLTQEKEREAYCTAYQITYRPSSKPTLEDWAPEGQTKLSHYPPMKSSVPEDDLHYPRAISSN